MSRPSIPILVTHRAGARKNIGTNEGEEPLPSGPEAEEAAVGGGLNLKTFAQVCGMNFLLDLLRRPNCTWFDTGVPLIGIGKRN